ncbi:MAG: hypothetical protein ACFFCV_01220 [Promethearchaeota archaeon]
MSHPELNQLTRAEELFDEGELEKALELLNDWKQFEGLNPQQKSYYQFIKGLILTYQHKFEEVIEWGEQIFEEGQKHNKHLQSFDGLFFIIIGFIEAEKIDEAHKLLDKAEDLLKRISDLSKKADVVREVRINLLKGWTYMLLGNIDLAEKSLERIFDLYQKLPNSFEIVWPYLLKGTIEFFLKKNTVISLKYLKKAYSIAKEIKFNHYWIAICHGYSAVIYTSIGDLDNSLKQYAKALKKMKGFQSFYLNTAYLNNVGNIYCEKGEYDLALKTLEECLILSEKKQSVGIEAPLSSLIEVALIKGDVKLAKKHFHRLENLYNQKKDSHIELVYYYSKALILERSSRIRDKAKAEELFKQVIGTKTMAFDLPINSYIHLCDLLFSEYQISNNDDVLDEINDNITQLLVIAEKSHSYLVFCEVFILQAKLALLTFKIKEARRLLTQAQRIAESYGITRLAMKISHEHDELLTQLNIWENYKKSEATLSERLRLAGLNEQMEDMIKKRMAEVPKLSDEDPVLLLIVSEGGIPTFSKLFTKSLVIEEDLISSFLAAFNTFSAELFSEGLDRASFGDFTLLMKPISTFLVCYLFKGQSFSAQKRIQSFVENMRNNEELLEKFNQYYKTNQVVKLQDVPLLNSLIIETFIKKKNF